MVCGRLLVVSAGFWLFAGVLWWFVVICGRFLVVCGHLWLLPVLVTTFKPRFECYHYYSNRVSILVEV